MDGGPALNRHWIKVSCFFGCICDVSTSQFPLSAPPSLTVMTYTKVQPTPATLHHPDYTRRKASVGLMLGHHLRQRARIKTRCICLYATARSHDQTRRASDSSIEYTKYSAPSKTGWIVATKALWCRSNVDPMPAQCLASVAAAGLTIKQQGDMCNVAGIVAY